MKKSISPAVGALVLLVVVAAAFGALWFFTESPKDDKPSMPNLGQVMSQQGQKDSAAGAKSPAGAGKAPAAAGGKTTP